MRKNRKTWILVGAAAVAVAIVALLRMGPVPASWTDGMSVQPTSSTSVRSSGSAGEDVDLVASMVVFGQVSGPAGLADGGNIFFSNRLVSASGAAGVSAGSTGFEPAVAPLGFRTTPADAAPGRASSAGRDGRVRSRGARARLVDASDPAGDLGNDAIRRTIGRKRGTFESCYWSARSTDPTLVGDVTFLLTVKTDGKVQVEVGDDSPRLNQAGVTACIKSRLETLDFTAQPPQGGDVRLRLPMSFLEP